MIRMNNPLVSKGSNTPNDAGEEEYPYRLRAGMLAIVTLPVGPGHSALMVPMDALVLDGKKASIFIAAENNEGQLQAMEVAVEIGIAVANEETPKKGDAVSALIEVKTVALNGQEPYPLEAGQQVIDQGNERLRNGQLIQLATPRD